jgi:hypothetical protein
VQTLLYGQVIRLVALDQVLRRWRERRSFKALTLPQPFPLRRAARFAGDWIVGGRPRDRLRGQRGGRRPRFHGDPRLAESVREAAFAVAKRCIHA